MKPAFPMVLTDWIESTLEDLHNVPLDCDRLDLACLVGLGRRLVAAGGDLETLGKAEAYLTSDRDRVIEAFKEQFLASTFLEMHDDLLDAGTEDHPRPFFDALTECDYLLMGAEVTGHTDLGCRIKDTVSKVVTEILGCGNWQVDYPGVIQALPMLRNAVEGSGIKDPTNPVRVVIERCARAEEQGPGA